MGNDFGNPNFAMTKSDYDKLEAAGKLNRPLGDPTMKRVSGGMHFTPQTPSKGSNDKWSLDS